MKLTLGMNISALQAQRQLLNTSERLSTVFERLASGQRINRASDDPAGLAIASSLRADARLYGQGIRNLNDGISLLNVADAAVSNLSTIVSRLEELATQASSGTLSGEQRQVLDLEAQALSDEYLRITQSTSFNDTRILAGELTQLSLQAGNGILEVGVGGAIGLGEFNNTTTQFTTETDRSEDVDLVDLNGDGILDLITTGSEENVQGYTTVRLGTGDGAFGASVSYLAESFISMGFDLGDLNGDGILDLVTVGENDGDQAAATIRLGRGDGTFGASTQIEFAGSEQATAVTLADLNGDGALDLVASSTDDAVSAGGDGFIQVAFGTGTGSFTTATSLFANETETEDVTVRDVNGDGILDIISTGLGGPLQDFFGYTSVRLGTGDGNFGDITQYRFGDDTSDSQAVELADLNNDGILDLITAGRNRPGGGVPIDGMFGVRLGNGDGTFGSEITYDTENRTSQDLAIADLNSDGILDVVTAGVTDAFDGEATVRFGNGDGTFGSSTASFETEDNESTSVVVADANQDGVLDIITAGRIDLGGAGYATIRLAETVDGAGPLLPFSLATATDAKQALSAFQNRRELLTTQRGEIGAYQSRIEVATNVLAAQREEFLAAESRITDVDMAVETAELVRLQILQQATSAVLAQANQQPALALTLLS